MLTRLLRSLLSTITAVCFTAGILALGAEPACPGAGPANGHQHHHGESGWPMPDFGRAPVGHSCCAVHLCCVHLGTSKPVALSAADLGAGAAADGFALGAIAPGLRSEHILPFAQAPPRLIL